MISYSEAINLINKNSLTIGKKRISIEQSLHRVCAENVISPSKYPSSNNSAFDGFALVSKETKGLNSKKTKKFKLLKTIAAGDNPKIKNYKKDSTIEIMTGAVLPKHFDTILPVENAKYFPSKSKPTHIVVDREIKKNSYVRFSGEDYQTKDIVLKKGEIIQANHLMAFAALGIKTVLVKKIPKIIFFGTGNELVDYRKKNISPWKVRNSNSLYFYSFGKSLHLEMIDGGMVKDNQSNKLKTALKKKILSDIDVLATSGAVSAGKFDFIPKFIKQLGFTSQFKGVKIKPGKPIMFSKYKKKIIFWSPRQSYIFGCGF